jgi:transcriptional regulator with XRE-family HTH domain
MTPFEMKLLPAQCRAARALLGWKQSDLAARARLTTKTVADFERGAREPLLQSIAFMRHAFEEAGVIVFDAEEGIGGIGVRLKWGVEVQQHPQTGADSGGTEGPTLGALSWEDEEASEWVPPEIEELRAYWRERPEQWAAMHKSSRWALLQEMGLREL